MIGQWWATLTGQPVAAERVDHANVISSLQISSAGLCCAVGYELRSAACAIRANMDHFQESHFLTETGDAIKIGRLPDQDCWGSARIARWIAWSVRDCLRDKSSIDASRCVLCVLAPEAERPDMADEPYREIIDEAIQTLGLGFHADSRIVPLGKGGLVCALRYASTRLAQPGIDSVLLVGADSLLSNAAIEHYLSDDRLIVPGNRDGFMPGEAAGAILLTRPALTERSVMIQGLGEATETARWNNDIPNRGFGLTEAVRAACQAAHVSPQQLQFRISDQAGEAYYTKEASNAFTRLMFGSHGISLLTLADKIGETGAASGVVALAYLSHVMSHKRNSPGHLGVVHVGNDNGLRSAVVVQLFNKES